ncbi:SH2 domain-containing protein 4A [Apodemus sylvaticus]|uniref:SH2 domain-containing protein 4A n=1 Tax=Apodemus sylvaticus TaxID=10129 RepID=UPI0022439FAC|nr:SH2 domain-containing protein 4A [Apodemus sylvaticus]XP_052017807.1 SH2 domain-containing protein 4A [Apodemus sylvaticus]
MLRQILSDMFIDPDLLAELSEEQKQILFYKMREEQIRRWKEREAAMERKESLPAKSRPKKENGKSVHWKLGADKQVWVWVMGEHHLDKPYDVLCDEILAEREHLRAAKASELRKAQSLELTNSLKVQSQNCDLQALKKTEPQNVTRKAASEEASGQGPRATPTREEDKAQTKELIKKKDHEEMKQTEDEKTKEIYKSWKEDSEWQASLRKSKAADEKRRSLAKQAREDYKRLSQRGRSGDGLQSPQKPRRPPLPPKPQFLQPPGIPPKSLGNQGVIRTETSSAHKDTIRWFKEEQLPFRAGYEKNTDTIAPWFHGILTLKKANELLSTGVPGSFLIRVSEKIKGYALSYLSEEGCKHFLIDASANSYSFLGVDQLQHATLADLVEYHKEEPITSLGKELLLYPCGQQDKPPDYLELFQ